MYKSIIAITIIIISITIIYFVKDNFVKDKLIITNKLIDAISRNNIEEVQQAIHQGIDIHSKNRSGKEALEIAAKKGNIETVNLLLKNGAIDHSSIENDTMAENAFTIAEENGYEEISQKILNTITQNENIIDCVRQKNITEDSMEQIMEDINEGAYVDVKITQGKHTLLMLVIGSNLAEDKKIEIIKLLINKGANVNATSKCGISVMIYTTGFLSHDIPPMERDSIQIIKLLIENGAKVNYSGRYQPLISSILSGHPNQVRFLLSQKASYDNIFYGDKKREYDVLQYILSRALGVIGYLSLVNVAHIAKSTAELLFKMAQDNYNVELVKMYLHSLETLTTDKNITSIEDISKTFYLVEEVSNELSENYTHIQQVYNNYFHNIQEHLLSCIEEYKLDHADVDSESIINYLNEVLPENFQIPQDIDSINKSPQ